MNISLCKPSRVQNLDCETQTFMILLGESSRNDTEVMMQEDSIRLNKYLAEAGICSRREADRLIEQGRVMVNGQPAVTGMKIEAGQTVTCDGKPVGIREEKVYLAFYKPRGIVCTSEKREKKNIIDYIHYPVRISYCGRLDKESEGLVIMTNDGELQHQMMRGANGHEKEYIVSVDRTVTKDFLEKMQAGVYLEELDVTTRACQTEKLTETSFRIILTQGLNRQIRRMCEQHGYRVMKLVRVRVMNVELGKLKAGQYRELTQEEYLKIKHLVQSRQICDDTNRSMTTQTDKQQNKQKKNSRAIRNQISQSIENQSGAVNDYGDRQK